MQETVHIPKKFNVRIEQKEDFYPTFKKWCTAREFPCIPLRQIDTVFVCYLDNVAVYSCFFWNTNSTFGVVGFPMSNPNVPYSEKRGGLTTLFDQITLTAKAGGYEIIWTTSDTDRVIEGLTEVGFKTADLKVDQYYKRLF
tara:strand:- start:21606 stop:22028 length:423 start_codon:yes stop_codon:yes gene_type:complete